MKWKVFERNVAKELGVWWCDDEKAFIRTPCSGGWPSKRAEGDVVGADGALYDAFPFCVDAKCRKNWDLETLLTHTTHPFVEWWYELGDMRPVREDGKLRLLIVSKTSGMAKALAVLGREEDQLLQQVVGKWPVPSVVFDLSRSEDPCVVSERLRIFKVRPFLECIDAEALKEYWERSRKTS